VSEAESGAAPAVEAARLAIDYPDRSLDRLSTALRPILALPILIVLGLLAGPGWDAGPEFAVGAGGLLSVPVALMLLFRRRYPRWWFDFNRELVRFGVRVLAYVALMDDRYPSTVEEQGVHLELDYPDAERDLNRWLPLVKWLLVLPHVVILVFLWIAAVFVVLYAWVVILATGRYPRGAFDFVAGVAGWQLRVAAYATLLITDRYPEFRLG
jgi:hypothetical protein